MLNTRSTSEKLAIEGIKLTPEQVAQLAKQGLFSGAKKDDGERWQIPESTVEQFIQYRKRQRRITWGTIIAIITVLGLISIANDFFDLTDKFFFNKVNPSTNSYVKIVTITPELGTELSRADLEQGIPIEIKVEYRNALPSGYKQGEVNPFISLSALTKINDDGSSNWRELSKEDTIFFGTGEIMIKSVLLSDYIRDDKIVLSIGLMYNIEGSERSYSSPDGRLIIEYRVKK